MKSAFLILAVIAGVALAVPASPSRRDVSEEPKLESAAKDEAPEVPATVEEAPKAEPKPARNTTARAAEASKNPKSEAVAPAQKPEEEKVGLVPSELPVSNESEAEKADEVSATSDDVIREELADAANPDESAEEMQGGEPDPTSFEKSAEVQSNAEAESAAEAEEVKAAEPDAPFSEELPQLPSADSGNEREQLINDMFEKLQRLKEMAQAN